MTNNPVSAGDCRRAMALISHHAVGDQAGITAIIDEAENADRATQLFIALLDAYRAIVPLLRTDSSITAMGQCIDITADAGADEQPDWVRAAATVIAAHRDNKPNRLFDAVEEIHQAHGGSGLLFQGVSDIYFHLMPELRAPAGLDALARWTVVLAGQEGSGQEEDE